MTPRDENIGLLGENLDRLTQPGKYYIPKFESVPSAVVCPASGEYSPQNESLKALHGPHAGAMGKYSVYDGGVYDGAGRIVPAAIHLGGGRRHLPGIDPPPAPVESLDGAWLWGGVLQPHFGHFLTESLGRLWAWPRVNTLLKGVVWLLPGEVPPHKVELYAAFARKTFMADVFGLLGIEGTHHVVTAPIAVRRLVVPNQLMMNLGGRGIAGHAVFRNFVRRMAESAPQQAPAERKPIYVSRAGMGTAGRFVLEEQIEAAFSAAGWRVLRPETMGIAEQIATYATADRLIFAEGSALHLFAMVSRPDQKVAVVSRRTPAKVKFQQQLRAYGLQDVHTIDVVTGAVLPMRPNAEGALMPAYRNDTDVLLDNSALERALVEHGFLGKGELRLPGPDPVMAAAQATCAARSGEGPHLPWCVVGREQLQSVPRGPNIREERLAETRAQQRAGAAVG
ncbi:glycosyltransferase family 61 protein [Falsiroseomonas sp.]|uniref:glycosyltransferase family 61 protein n=1 Tax=Falsiroseomonas sp. TaxID=2870721 RepID=UPI00356241C2